MNTIRCFYEKDPGFPASDQHHDAVRYPISAGIFTLVDAIGGEPTPEEIAAALTPPSPAPRTREQILADISALTAEVRALP